MRISDFLLSSILFASPLPNHLSHQTQIIKFSFNFVKRFRLRFKMDGLKMNSQIMGGSKNGIGWFLKWTIARKWTVRSKVGGLERLKSILFSPFRSYAFRTVLFRSVHFQSVHYQSVHFKSDHFRSIYLPGPSSFSLLGLQLKTAHFDTRSTLDQTKFLGTIWVIFDD